MVVGNQHRMVRLLLALLAAATAALPFGSTKAVITDAPKPRSVITFLIWARLRVTPQARKNMAL